MFVIVPEALSAAINAKLDAEIAKCPDAANDREHLYMQVLAHFNDYGRMPEFTLARVEPDPLPADLALADIKLGKP